jgi:hypothetical protein
MILSQKSATFWIMLSFQGQKGRKVDNRRRDPPATILLKETKQIRPPVSMAEQ